MTNDEGRMTKVSKGPGRVRLLRLPQETLAAMYFAESVTRARELLARARFAQPGRELRGLLADARAAGRWAREYHAQMRGVAA